MVLTRHQYKGVAARSGTSSGIWRDRQFCWRIRMFRAATGTIAHLRTFRIENYFQRHNADELVFSFAAPASVPATTGMHSIVASTQPP
eukprot:6193168-Pleurochrysis_carterae.AAC.1